MRKKRDTKEWLKKKDGSPKLYPYLISIHPSTYYTLRQNISVVAVSIPITLSVDDTILRYYGQNNCEFREIGKCNMF